MNKSIALYTFLVVVLLFTGCTLTRPDESAGDIEEFTPPTAAVTAQSPPADVAAQVPTTGVTAQANEALARLQPASQNLQMGEAVAIEVRVERVTNLLAADLRLQFNPGVVQVQDADPNKEGVQIGPGNFPSPDFVALNVVTNTTGTVLYAVTQLAGTAPVSGDGLLASITFQAVGVGESELTMSTLLVNSAGQAIPTMLEFSKIMVGTPGGDLPTATATFSSSPSPTSTTATTVTPTVTGTTISLTPTPISPTTPTPTLPPTLTPLPTPTPTNTPIIPITQIPAGGTVGFCYRVKTGETLEGLAAANGTTAQAIQWTNDLYPPYYTYVNQALFIPKSLGTGLNFYIVQTGDTLSSIAETCNLPADFIAWVNKLDQAVTLPVGHVLEIPRPPFPPPARYLYPPSGPFGPPSVFPPLSYGTYPPQPSQPPKNGGNCDYIVQPGDTLYSICRRYGVSVEALKQANGIYDANYIYAGQCLVIPNRR